MKKSRLAFDLALSLALPVALSIVLAPGAATAGPPRASGPAKTQPPGPREGIKVHGRWTIEVRNPDGTTALKREFDNALAPGAGLTLSAILARAATTGSWRIQLWGATTELSPCKASAGHTAVCHLAEQCFAYDPCSPGLTVTAPQSGENQEKLILSGSVLAQRDGSIKLVKTTLTTCEPGISPSTCGGLPRGDVLITVADLPAAIPVLTGQQVLVTVVISFT